jgi:hypothetical protein
VLHVEGDAWLGVVDEATWWMGKLGGPQREIDLSNPIGLLPCLERPYSVVAADLEAKADELSGAGFSLPDGLSLAAIPRTAAAGQQTYWAELALAWLADMPPSEDSLGVLRTLEDADWATQAIRHQARRIRRGG